MPPQNRTATSSCAKGRILTVGCSTHCARIHTPLSSCAKRRTWMFAVHLTARTTPHHYLPERSEGPGLLAVQLTAHATTLHCHPARSEGPGCLLFPSPPAQPLTIVFLSEAKDLDCWLFPHCPHNHTPLSSCAKRRTWTFDVTPSASTQIRPER